MKKQFRALSLSLFLCAFALAPHCAAQDGAVFHPESVVFVDGAATLLRSGETLFRDDFETSDAWEEIGNYLNLLSFSFGTDASGSRLLIERADAKSEESDDAWKLRSGRRALPENASGREIAFKITTSASKLVAQSEGDGDGWKTRVLWFDERDKPLGRLDLPFQAQRDAREYVVFGEVPQGAAFFRVQVGCDAPNVGKDGAVVLRAVDVELVDRDRPYFKRGAFETNVFPRVGALRLDADVPDGCAIALRVAPVQANADNPTEPDALDVDFDAADVRDAEWNATARVFELPDDLDAPFLIGRFELVPNGAQSPVVRAVDFGNGRFVPLTKSDATPPRVKLVGERATPNPAENVPIKIEIADPSCARASSIRVEVDEKDETEKFDVRRDSFELLTLVERDPSAREKGLHFVVVDVEDARGNAVRATRAFLVGEPAKTPVVSLRDDGATLIDGEPFFPIGIYGVMKRMFNGYDIDEAFRGLKASGFNFAHSYAMPRDDEFLAAAEKYGFKLWSVARLPDERFVDVERFSPAIIAWYLGDDTHMNTTPEELDDYNLSVKAVDPTRLTVQADPIETAGEISTYLPYVDGTDAFLPEIYPVRRVGSKSGAECVAKTIRDVRLSRADAARSSTGVKAVWPIIQYFQGWGWQRFPTREELRAMSFAALAAGANGITWYTYGGTVNVETGVCNYGAATTTERWTNMTDTATQIRELAPVLLERTDLAAQPTVVALEGTPTNALGDPAIVCLLKTRGDVAWLIAVNSADSELKVRFDFPETLAPTEREPELLFDESGGRAAPKFDGTALVDSLEGFGVRVYRFAVEKR